MGLSTEAQYFEQKAYLTIELYRSQRPPLMAGRLITAEDNEFQNYVIDLSQEQARQLFGDDPAEGPWASSSASSPLAGHPGWIPSRPFIVNV